MYKDYAITFGGSTLLSIGFLTGSFVMLKTSHVIAWTWVWVLSPLWIPMAVAILCLLGFLFFLAIIAACVYAFGRKN